MIRENTIFLECFALTQTLALYRYDTPLVWDLTRAGACVNCSDDKGWTALHIAAKTGDRAAAEWLLQNGADPNARNSYGMTPLMLAVVNGHRRIVEVLLSWGANPALRDVRGWTAMDLAKKSGSCEKEQIIQLLNKCLQKQKGVETEPPGKPSGVETSA